MESVNKIPISNIGVSNLRNFTTKIAEDKTLNGYCKDINNPSNMEIMRWAANAYKMMDNK